MKAISLWQPWASWIAFGWKTIETRKHARFENLVEQRIAIHAARTFDSAALGMAQKYLAARGISQRDIISKLNTDYHGGVIVATAFVKCHRLLEPVDAQASMIECDSFRFGLELEDIRRISPGIAFKGRQGIFNVDDALFELV